MDTVPDPNDEAACARWLFHLRWGDGFACARCEHPKASQLACRPRVWSCHACRKHHSVTAGTSLHRCKVPLGKILVAAGLLARAESISGRALERLLRISHEAAWALLQRLRAGLVRRGTTLGPDRVTGDVATKLRGLGKEAWPVVLIAGDAEGRVVARMTTDRLFEGVRLSEGRYRWVNGHPVALWIATVLEHVHDTVSLRWVERYVGALAAVQTVFAEGLDPTRAVLDSALRCPSRGFAVDQRPPRNPCHPSWKAIVWRLNPVRLDRVELPLSIHRRVDLRRGWLAARPRE